MLLAAHHQTADLDLLRRYLRETRQTYAARAIAYIAVHYLGLPPKLCPLSLEGIDHVGERLLDDILRSDNFVQRECRVCNRPQDYRRGELSALARALRRVPIMMKYAPSELFWYPIKMFSNSITATFLKFGRQLWGLADGFIKVKRCSPELRSRGDNYYVQNYQL
jgi:hypothetical protein